MRFTIPFASVLLVASLNCIWATPIAVDRGSEIQQRSESHLNGRATENEVRAPIQGDSLLPEGGEVKEDQTKGEPKEAPRSRARVTSKPRNGQVRYFKLTQATNGDVDDEVQNFVQEALDNNGIRAIVRQPKSTGVLGKYPVAKFEFNYFEPKYKSDPNKRNNYKGDTYTGFWNPTEKSGKMYDQNGKLLYSKTNK
ncbi:hypothetical protein BDP27DRAFT_1430293 [Rhodocollybia butyracea]|uniref:Uncharacterized protein n=1 Tax=Rhodocollybia butyracea TaxID=206335 RepID=A0A9P5U087_9AGAR|nr:hypothetical protein BDP27DRAFT_1430293 [Rhodocollybia butyracea]